MLKHSDHGFPFQVKDNNILKKRKEASLIPPGSIYHNLVGSTYGKFCLRFPQNRMKGQQQSVLAP
jgi:hypothetical protein